MHAHRLRAMSALAMAAMFYVFALATASGLAWAGIELAHASVDQFHGRGALVGLLGAAGLLIASGLIAWSILPRFQRFTPPGPELLRAEQPALFRELERVARLTNEEMPRHVYLVADVNAFVSQPGFSKQQRIMGLGLPLLTLLSVSELRAVLTHEFGHYAKGDASLGPWLAKTRGALVRTLTTLSGAAAMADRAGASEVGLLRYLFMLVSAPFRAYAEWYLRFTQGLSREQEYAADALAVQLEGAPALTRGLTRTHGGAFAFHVFLRNEFAPILNLRFVPPFCQGFAAFISVDEMAQVIDSGAAEQLGGGQTDVYDSHPPLAERVARAGQLTSAADHPPDDRRALELLANVPALETQLALDWADEPLQPIAWSRTGELLAKGWASRAPAHAKLLNELTPASLPRDEALLRELLVKEAMTSSALAPSTISEQLAGIARAQLLRWAKDLYAEALFALLVRAEFRPHNLPGQALRFTRGEHELVPGPLIASYLEGELTEEAWRAVWAAAGLANASFEPTAS